MFVSFGGPFFVVSHKQVEHYRSPIYDGVKRGDRSLLMVLCQPVVVCGDVMLEFFNKPKMLAKVRRKLHAFVTRASNGTPPPATQNVLRKSSGEGGQKRKLGRKDRML